MTVLTPPVPKEKMDHPVAQSETQIGHYLTSRTTFFTWSMHLRAVLKHVQGNCPEPIQAKYINDTPRDRLEVKIAPIGSDLPRYYTVTFGYGAYCLVEGSVSEDSTLR